STWRAVPALPGQPRQQAAIAFGGGALWVHGGYSVPGAQPLGDSWMLNLATLSWSQLPAAPLTPRSAVVSAFGDGRFYVWGGRDGTTPIPNALADGAYFDLSSRQWEMLPAWPYDGRVG